MPTSSYLDVGPGLGGGYRVVRIRGLRCDAQLLFDTANDVAGAARLLGMAVLTADEAVQVACAQRGVALLEPGLARQEYLPL